MSNVRIMNQNYIDSDYLVSQTKSSEQTIAPATNVYDGVRRSKVWRTNGYWEITSANKTIIFQESIGVDLTATIAEANYTSTTTFLAAIKTALDAAGDSTYTVTQDTSTLKIKITSNGSGGGGVFRLIWTSVSSTAATTLGFSTAADDTGALSYTADTLKIHTSEFLVWDLGISSNPKAFVLLGLRNTAIKLSSNAVIRLEGNSTNTWGSPQYTQTLAYNENAIIAFDDDGLDALRYWRLYIEDKSNPLGYIEISNIYLGDVVTFTRGSVQFPLEISFDDLASVQFSENGTSFADIRQQTAVYSLDWFGLTTTEYEELQDFIEDTGLAKPFYISLDPDANFSSTASKWVKFVRFTTMPRHRLSSPGVFSGSWEVREEL